MGNFAISGFAAAILEFRMVMDMPGLCHLMIQYIESVDIIAASKAHVNRSDNSPSNNLKLLRNVTYKMKIKN